MSYNLEEIQNGYEKLKCAFSPTPEEKKYWIFDNHVVISYRCKNETETTHKAVF